MRLHQNEELFRQAIQFTAQEMGIPEIFIEKDYWVTFTLYTIFNSDMGPEAVFKGGTSLLKCYGLIKRFSEDIDLVVLRREGESNNKLTNKIKAISEIVSIVLPARQFQFKKNMVKIIGGRTAFRPPTNCH
jgi:predicted nucleotidyltransferase component of viral defense system